MSPLKSAVRLSAVLLARLMSMLETTAPKASMRRRADVPFAPTTCRVVPGWPAGAACVLFETVSLVAGVVVPTPTLPVFVLLMFPLASGCVHCASTSGAQADKNITATTIRLLLRITQYDWCFTLTPPTFYRLSQT